MGTNRTAELLPPHLAQFVVEQDPNRYTPENHATWRFIMRQNRDFFRTAALPIYQTGLEKTGILIHRIPSIDHIDQRLQDLGWGAVAVSGFIPPNAFLEFGARRILPIAYDMRRMDHIGYTPAPDIVHEAAGHAPILVDKEYSEYLQCYAEMATKTISHKKDTDLYLAIRTLSDLKENPDASPDDIEKAALHLETISGAGTEGDEEPSEASLVARMNWWTVEYGLMGSLQNPKIYGAGLLSSVAESQSCLSPKVLKLPLSVHCIRTPYVITEPQPQLYVADSMSHLKEVLKEFDQTLSYRVGGVNGLKKAKISQTVNTVTLDSGLQISGILSDYDSEENTINFIRMTGPVQLCHGSKELAGHGVLTHPSGFSSPLGPLKGPLRSLVRARPSDLSDLGCYSGAFIHLQWENGFELKGNFLGATFQKGQLLLLSFQNATLTRRGVCYFEPSWGTFDLAVGESVPSVSGGCADGTQYPVPEVPMASTSPARKSPYSEQEKQIFEAFSSLRAIREDIEKRQRLDERLIEDAQKLFDTFASSWLIRLEVLEIIYKFAQTGQVGALNLFQKLELEFLSTLAPEHADLLPMIRHALKTLEASDDVSFRGSFIHSQNLKEGSPTC